ncbi:MAG: adenosine deaminase [Bacteroidetes bacterium]|nr:adenosine deaminase [Bacteroidota bacterium]
MDLKQLPKVELHLHLDCSLSFEVVRKLKPGITKEAYQHAFVAPAHCLNLAEYIACAGAAIEIMQSREQLEVVTLDLFDQLVRDNVIYAEIRFAPLQHLEGGLSPNEVVEAVKKAIEKGSAKTGVEARLILCTLRHFDESQSMETIRLVEQHLGDCVAGFDIAADEAGYPIDAHISAFQYAHKKGIPSTAHAGEARGAESVWESLHHFHPQRIGHGVRSLEDPELIQYLRDKNIHLEVCPTSNIQTNIYQEYGQHALDTIFETGISMSISTDGRTISAVDLNTEYQKIVRTFGWGIGHFLKCNLEAVEHAFLPEAKKKVLRQQIIDGFRGG